MMQREAEVEDVEGGVGVFREVGEVVLVEMSRAGKRGGVFVGEVEGGFGKIDGGVARDSGVAQEFGTRGGVAGGEVEEGEGFAAGRKLAVQDGRDFAVVEEIGVLEDAVGLPFGEEGLEARVGVGVHAAGCV